ncbi:MAG: hypothetical protein FWE20_08775 [Defluviitaleaceae bacterium]|nr:hypothetical protein [Defluviitaleaceae bacterium]
MGSNTKIYDKFQGYTSDDCQCIYCQHFKGKKQGCSLAECCCAEEKVQALMREQGLEREDAEGLVTESRAGKVPPFTPISAALPIPA